ncbi:condensation domain-containing protein [Gordonia sp. CPCC 205515]|uniref:condensation domain-containing protein n=1 Tax=Gordonia sp. CPCC 205515 TaxID=3140791 RepID=UPI003AF3DD4F
MSRIPTLRHPAVGGPVLHWVLTDPEKVSAATVPTPDGASFLQLDHLAGVAAKRAAGEPHTGTAASITVFDEPLDRDAMAAALTDFVRRHDELRAVYAATPTGVVRSVAPADAITLVTVDDGIELDGEDLVRHIVDRIEAQALPDRMPGVVFGAADGGDRFTFYLGMDHAHSDGFSQIAALHEIAGRYRAHRAGSPPAPASAASFTDHISAEKVLAAELRPDDPRVEDWRTILATTGGVVPGFPLPLGLDDARTPMPAHILVRDLLDVDRLAGCDARSRPEVTFTGVIYAALAAALHELTGADRYFTATVLSTRTAETLDTQGWLCNFAPVAFPIDPAAPFSALVAEASAAVRRARDLGTVPVHAVLGTLAAEGAYQPTADSPQMVSYIDFRRTPGLDDPTVTQATMFTGIGRTRNANMWFSRFPDRLEVGAQLPDNDVARQTLTTYLDVVSRLLSAYAAGEDPLVTTPLRRGVDTELTGLSR